MSEALAFQLLIPLCISAIAAPSPSVLLPFQLSRPQLSDSSSLPLDERQLIVITKFMLSCQRQQKPSESIRGICNVDTSTWKCMRKAAFGQARKGTQERPQITRVRLKNCLDFLPILPHAPQMQCSQDSMTSRLALLTSLTMASELQ